MLKFDRPTLVTLTAPTCSGKNYLRDAIENEFNWTRIISTTTRQPRAGELHRKDYYFITDLISKKMEEDGSFAELITFRGTRYGVTRREMDSKMDARTPPMVILEPQGLEMYKTMCTENGWDIFTIYISLLESTRIERLIKRTVADVRLTLSSCATTEKVIQTHTDRLLSITGDERQWSNQSSWDAILPGDNVTEALDGLKMAVDWRNRKTQTPTTYDHYAVN